MHLFKYLLIFFKQAKMKYSNTEKKIP